MFLRSVGGMAVAAGTGASNGLAGSTPRLDPEAPLRIGMIGRTGHLGYVLNRVEEVPGARIAAYAFEDGDWDFNSDGSRRGSSYDMNRQREWVDRQRWAKSNPRLYETYQEMLDKEKLDLAVVCLPYARNAFAISAAAQAGLNILSEKPVATNSSDLEMVRNAIANADVRLSAMFAMRYSAPIYTVWKTVQRGEIGNPLLARAQKSYKWGYGRPWFYKDREIYGSTILWVGIHAVDYVRWCTGLEVRRVSGFHSNLSHLDYPGAQDNAVLNMEFENGATASITMDFLRPKTAPTHGDDRLRIAGSKGVVESIADSGNVTLLSAGEEPRTVEQEQPDWHLLPDFVAELRGQGRHLIGPDDAVRVTEICIAATEAADKRTTLTV
jgi:predicted dehydrogenase